MSIYLSQNVYFCLKNTPHLSIFCHKCPADDVRKKTEDMTVKGEVRKGENVRR